MTRALFGSLTNKRQIGNAYTRQAKLAGVTASPQDVRREHQWRQRLSSPEVVARRDMAESTRIEREFTGLAGELGAQAIDKAAESEVNSLAQSAAEVTLNHTVEYALDKRTVLV